MLEFYLGVCEGKAISINEKCLLVPCIPMAKQLLQQIIDDIEKKGFAPKIIVLREVAEE